MTPRSFLALLASLSLVLGLLVAGTAATAHAVQDGAGRSAIRPDRDCGDFGTQAAAQRYFISIGGPRVDRDNLDADRDGVACESNPCPCSTATSGGGPSTPSEPPRTPLEIDRAVVVQVIDGDTVDVRLTRSGRKHRVRLLGIDTPEVYGGRECGGPEASASARSLLPRGTPVILTSDRTQDLKDRFGRILRYVQKARGSIDVGRVQVHRGHARVYVYQGKAFTKVRKYRAEEASARRAGRGLWGRCR